MAKRLQMSDRQVCVAEAWIILTRLHFREKAKGGIIPCQIHLSAAPGERLTRGQEHVQNVVYVYLRPGSQED